MCIYAQIVYGWLQYGFPMYRWCVSLLFLDLFGVHPPNQAGCANLGLTLHEPGDTEPGISEEAVSSHLVGEGAHLFSGPVQPETRI